MRAPQFINYNMYRPVKQTTTSAPDEIRHMAGDAAFGKRLITNNYRGLVAEAIVASVLGPDWTWCSADYAGWDFDRSDGVRLEVKQSAARQTWKRANGKPSICSFDIKARQGRYEGADWFDDPGRSADLYVFAHHFVVDDEADHCDPHQWRFYVVPTTDLPASKTIGLSSLAKVTSACQLSKLAAVIDRVADAIVARRAAPVLVDFG